MNYKSLMGYGKKKKVTKKESKPKVNKVLESIKEEFGFIKEVGAGDEYMPHVKKITDLYSDYWGAIQDFEELLIKKGLKKQGNQFHRMYINMVAKYHKWFVKNLRKLM